MSIVTMSKKSDQQRPAKYQHSRSGNVPHIERSADDQADTSAAAGARSLARHSDHLIDRCGSVSPTHVGCFASFRRLRRHGSGSRQSSSRQSSSSGGSVESAGAFGGGQANIAYDRENTRGDNVESSDSDNDDDEADNVDQHHGGAHDSDDHVNGSGGASKSLRFVDVLGPSARRRHGDDRKSEARLLGPAAMAKSTSLIDLKSLARKFGISTASGWFCCFLYFVRGECSLRVGVGVFPVDDIRTTHSIRSRTHGRIGGNWVRSKCPPLRVNWPPVYIGEPSEQSQRVLGVFVVLRLRTGEIHNLFNLRTMCLAERWHCSEWTRARAPPVRSGLLIIVFAVAVDVASLRKTQWGCLVRWATQAATKHIAHQIFDCCIYSVFGEHMNLHKALYVWIDVMSVSRWFMCVHCVSLWVCLCVCIIWQGDRNIHTSCSR